jgi:hypothetical protein
LTPRNPFGNVRRLMPWVLTGAAVLVAALAMVRTRRTARRLERLQESYWDLRYELGQLQARVSRLESDGMSVPPAASAPGEGAAAFVPLSSLKR